MADKSGVIADAEEFREAVRPPGISGSVPFQMNNLRALGEVEKAIIRENFTFGTLYIDF
ncbi:MAG TPA: hypothetical protein VG273_06240 [Bryobacteraceae bacterium]|jgi:hypothetical protein|nr:hypothetical protein [Bryobacteraceae bacterium]